MPKILYEIIDSFIHAQLGSCANMLFVLFIFFPLKYTLDAKDVLLIGISVGAGKLHDSIYFDSCKK